MVLSFHSSGISPSIVPLLRNSICQLNAQSLKTFSALIGTSLGLPFLASGLAKTYLRPVWGNHHSLLASWSFNFSEHPGSLRELAYGLSIRSL